MAIQLPEWPHASANLRDSLLYGGNVGGAVEEWRSDDLRKATNEDKAGRELEDICADPRMAHARVLRDVEC